MVSGTTVPGTLRSAAVLLLISTPSFRVVLPWPRDGCLETSTVGFVLSCAVCGACESVPLRPWRRHLSLLRPVSVLAVCLLFVPSGLTSWRAGFLLLLAVVFLVTAFGAKECSRCLAGALRCARCRFVFRSPPPGSDGAAAQQRLSEARDEARRSLHLSRNLPWSPAPDVRELLALRAGGEASHLARQVSLSIQQVEPKPGWSDSDLSVVTYSLSRTAQFLHETWSSPSGERDWADVLNAVEEAAGVLLEAGGRPGAGLDVVVPLDLLKSAPSLTAPRLPCHLAVRFRISPLPDPDLVRVISGEGVILLDVYVPARSAALAGAARDVYGQLRADGVEPAAAADLARLLV